MPVEKSKSKKDDSAFTLGSDGVMPMGALVDETSPDSADEGDVGIPRMTASRILRVALSADGGGSIAKAEDAAHASGDLGIMLLAVRQNTAAALAGTDGDYIPVIVDASGRLHIAPAPANSGVDIGDVDVLSIAAGDNNIGNVDIVTLPAVNLSGNNLKVIVSDAITSGSNIIGRVGIDQTTPGTTNGVQVNAALPAGTNAIGKLAANSGVDIGDVDILSIAAGDNNIGNVDLASAIPAGTNNIGDIDVLTINGVAPQFDNTDVMAVSVNGMGTVAGDSPLRISVASGSTLASQPLAVGMILADGANPRPVTSANQIGFGSGGSNILPALMVSYNPASDNYDPWVQNHEVTALASAARTASVDSADLTNRNGRGVVVVIDVTAITATPSITVTIQGKSALGSDYYTILASAAIVGTGQTVLRVYPGLVAAANSVVNDVIPRLWRVSVANGDADEITYSVSANYIL